MGIPILHMIRETARLLVSQGRKRPGILATDGTIQTGLYQREFAALGLEPLALLKAHGTAGVDPRYMGLGPVEAVGRLRFWAGDAAQEERTVPAGTVCMTAGLVRFETTEPGVIPAGELSVLVPARALAAGTAGNAAAGTVTVMAVAPAGIARCGNPEPFSVGVEAAGEEALRARLLDTFLRLPNGVNAAFYQREALSFDQVAAAAVIPRPRGIGTVDIVAATQAGVPDEALLKELQEYFQSRREIAVEVRVRGPVLQEIDVALSVTAEAGRDRAAVQAAVEQAVRAWFRGERLGRDVLRAQLGDLVFHCGGVANYRITAPAADVAVGADVLPRLGTLKVEVTA